MCGLFELGSTYSPSVVGLGPELEVDATFSSLLEVVEELTSPDSLAIWVATSKELIRDVPNRYSIARVLNGSVLLHRRGLDWPVQVDYPPAPGSASWPQGK